MSLSKLDLLALGWLASMPFLDRLELAAVSGASYRSVYDAVAELERRGLAASFSHATDLLRTTRRFHLTAGGLHRLAETGGITLDELLRSHPVSAQWRRVLLERLDAVGIIYRLASFIAAEQGPVGFHWYRAAPLDAAMELPGGRTIGVVRQGTTTDRTGFSKRLWRLREGPMPSAVLMLMPDEVRLRHARRLFAGTYTFTLLALERDAAWAGPADPVWRLPSVATTLDLRYVLSHTGRGGTLSTEPERLRATLPGDLTLEGLGKKTHHWMMPTLLQPGEKRLLDLLYDWPGMAPDDLRGLMGVSRPRLSQIMAHLLDFGLIRRISIRGRRLALTDRGLAMLARRDRASVGAARRRWSVARLDPDAPDAWRNVFGRRSRQLLRNVDHTAAVHSFVAALAKQCRSLGWELVQMDPPFRASRYYRLHGLFLQMGGLRSVHADAFGVLRRRSATIPFFLEWERRAVRPSTMAKRLAPYLGYYSSHRPPEDHGTQPILLVVFQDELAATHFLRVAQGEMNRTGVNIPLRVSHRAAIDQLGPLGQAWRYPGDWEVAHPLSAPENPTP